MDQRVEGLTWEECEAAVRGAIAGPQESIALVDYSVQPASGAPIGFMGTHFRALATVALEGKEKQQVRMFAKRPPVSHSHQSYVAVCSLFRREAHMYNSYVPRMKRALKEQWGETALPLPRCFFARGEDKGSDLIVLEDVSCRGYQMANKREPMDLPTCKAVLGAMARLHGASVLLQSHEGLYRKGEFESMEEPIFFDDMSHPACRWHMSSAETLSTAVSLLWPERFGGREGKKKVLDAAWGSCKEIFRIVKKSEDYLNVLCHGDIWANNIMLRYGEGVQDDGWGGEDSGVVALPEVVLVDFQQQRFCPPALEIVYFLHATTRKAFRDRHLDHLLDHYRRTFAGVVGPQTADRLLSPQHLKGSMHQFRVFGRYFAMPLLSVVLPSDGEEPKEEEEVDFIDGILRDRGEEVVMKMEGDPLLKERLQETYQEYLESVGLWDDRGE